MPTKVDVTTDNRTQETVNSPRAIQGNSAMVLTQADLILERLEASSKDISNDPVKPKSGASEKKDNDQECKGDMRQLLAFTFLIGLGNMQSGFAIAGNNQVAPVIKIKFGWDESEATLYNTFISASAIVGVVLGAICGGRFIQYGRRRSVIIFNCISAASLVLTMFLDLHAICIGRLIYGFCCGVIQVAGVKMLEETIPMQNMSAFGTATNSLMALGIMIAIVLAVGLPDGDDYEGMKKDQFYRVIYGFPWVFQALMLLMLFTCYKQDSIVFLIQQENNEEALKIIKKVYAKDEDPNKVLNVVKMQSSSHRRSDDKAKDTDNKISITQAMFDPRYRKATWIAFLLCFFQQQTGLDGIMIYSNVIFAEMAKRGSISFSAKVGSYIVGCWSLFMSLVAPLFLNHFRRRTLLLVGQMSMAISLIAVALFYIYEHDILTIIFLNWFILSFQLSQGPIAWMYAGEIATDAGLGLAVLALYASLLEKAITMEFMVHSDFFGPSGMFFFLGGVTLAGAIFIFFFIKETKGLDDKQKKLLYTPKELIPEDDILQEVELEAQANQSSRLINIGRQKSFQEQRNAKNPELAQNVQQQVKKTQETQE